MFELNKMDNSVIEEEGLAEMLEGDSADSAREKVHWC
jgi:hypothetical protein